MRRDYIWIAAAVFLVVVFAVRPVAALARDVDKYLMYCAFDVGTGYDSVFQFETPDRFCFTAARHVAGEYSKAVPDKWIIGGCASGSELIAIAPSTSSVLIEKFDSSANKWMGCTVLEESWEFGSIEDILFVIGSVLACALGFGHGLKSGEGNT